MFPAYKHDSVLTPCTISCLVKHLINLNLRDDDLSGKNLMSCDECVNEILSSMDKVDTQTSPETEEHKQ